MRRVTQNAIRFLGNDATDEQLLMDFLRELWAFLKSRKKLWLLPIILVLLLLGALIVFVQGSAIAPFIYTLF